MAWIPTNMTSFPSSDGASTPATSLQAEATLIDYLSSQLNGAMGLIVELENQLAELHEKNEELECALRGREDSQ